MLGRYGRELQLLSLTDAVRKMTGLPAETFRLRDRGSIREGYWADLVLFNPNTIRDTANFAQPMSQSVGMKLCG